MTSKEILDPILVVFSGEDGGVAYANLFHRLMPDMIEKAKTNDRMEEIVKSFETVSKLCKLITKT
jgi:hypothetical protein